VSEKGKLPNRYDNRILYFFCFRNRFFFIFWCFFCKSDERYI